MLILLASYLRSYIGGFRITFFVIVPFQSAIHDHHWPGNYRIVEENGRMVMKGDYIYYPNNQLSKAVRVEKSFYIS